MLPTTGAVIVDSASVPAAEGFDTVAIVRYPSRAAFLAMIDDPQFQEMSIHKNGAGVAETNVLATDLVSLDDMTFDEIREDFGVTGIGLRASHAMTVPIATHRKRVDRIHRVRNPPQAPGSRSAHRPAAQHQPPREPGTTGPPPLGVGRPVALVVRLRLSETLPVLLRIARPTGPRSPWSPLPEGRALRSG